MAKTYKKGPQFNHVVTTAEASANKVELVIKSGPLPTSTFDFVCQVRRAGVEIPGFDVDYSTVTGILTIADAGSANLTANDRVVVFGAFFK